MLPREKIVNCLWDFLTMTRQLATVLLDYPDNYFDVLQRFSTEMGWGYIYHRVSKLDSIPPRWMTSLYIKTKRGESFKLWGPLRSHETFAESMKMSCSMFIRIYITGDFNTFIRIDDRYCRLNGNVETY